MNIGCARVSTSDQNLDLQLEAFKMIDCKRVFLERSSGAHRHRHELERLFDQRSSGDTVVVWKLDRLARSTRDLLEIAETIRAVGASFRSLSEPWADTTSHAGKLIMTLFTGLAEFERDLIRERTSAGRSAAQLPSYVASRKAKQSAMWPESSRCLEPPSTGWPPNSDQPEKASVAWFGSVATKARNKGAIP